MNDDQHAHHQLSADDALAVDALIESGLDPARVPVSLQARAGKVASLLSLLNLESKTDSTLIDVTLARVLRAGSPGHVETDAALCADDVEALDAYVAAEFRAPKVAASLRPRAEQVEAIVRLISQTPTHYKSSAGLIDRTMRQVATTKEADLSPIPIRRGGGIKLADLVSIAAVLMIGVAVLWPILSTVRTYQQKGACAANLGTVASAMGAYAGDSRDALPLATASYGGSWLDVGTTPDRSNSANLFTLAKAGYAKLRDLACPGNPNAVTQAPSPTDTDWQSLPKVSYSYYIMFGPSRPTPTANPRTIVLADKSPVVVRELTHETIPFPDENSPNHEGKGQWALRADGTANWMTSPKDGYDNIWLSQRQQDVWDKLVVPKLAEIRRAAPKDAKAIIIDVVGAPLFQGNELPESATDSILGP